MNGLGASARGGHSAVLYGNELYIFGGQYFSGEFQYLNDIHVLDVEVKETVMNVIYNPRLSINPNRD